MSKLEKPITIYNDDFAKIVIDKERVWVTLGQREIMMTWGRLIIEFVRIEHLKSACRDVVKKLKVLDQ